MSISSAEDKGIVGFYLNENPRGFTQGYLLQRLTTTRSVVIPIPMI